MLNKKQVIKKMEELNVEYVEDSCGDLRVDYMSESDDYFGEAWNTNAETLFDWLEECGAYTNRSRGGYDVYQVSDCSVLGYDEVWDW